MAIYNSKLKNVAEGNAKHALYANASILNTSQCQIKYPAAICQSRGYQVEHRDGVNVNEGCHYTYHNRTGVGDRLINKYWLSFVL